MKLPARAILSILVLALLPASARAAGVDPSPGSPGADTVSGCGVAVRRAGGPDDFGYTFKDSAEPGGPAFTWIDLSTTGTSIPFEDDTVHGPFDLGFAFNFYGTGYSEIWASSNGWLSVTAPPGSDFSNDCPLPSIINTTGLIAGLWDDLDNDTASPFGTGYYQAYPAGTCPWGGYAGACFIAEWYGMYHLLSVPPDDMWFEILLLDNGDIVLQFLDASGEAGDDSTTGIENAGATDGLTYACDTPGSLGDGRAVRFYYPPHVPRFDRSAKTAPASAHTGEAFAYSVVIRNSGLLTGTATSMVDPIPAGAAYVPGSVTGGAAYNAALNRIEYTGDIAPRTATTVTFMVTATIMSGAIRNNATITQMLSPAGVVVTATTAVSAAPNITVQPAGITSTQSAGVQTVHPLTIGNTGYAALNWRIGELGADGRPPGRPAAVLHDNGPLITHPGGGFAGADASAMQSALGLSTFGFAHSPSSGYRVADDFTVTATSGWQIDTITFYAYQPGSGTASTIDEATLRIWDGRPGDPGASVVWGDATTNVLASSAFSHIYRVQDTHLTYNDRPIMAGEVAVNTLLPPGEYWLDWQTGGTLPSGPWAPPVSILGQATTGNARHYDPGAAAWTDLRDYSTLTPQGLPFIIEGTEYQCTDDIPWLSGAPITGTTAPGANSAVSVTLDSTGLAPAAYAGVLCVISDDPDTPVAGVPVTLTVTPPTSVTVTAIAARAPAATALGLAALAAAACASILILRGKLPPGPNRGITITR